MESLITNGKASIEQINAWYKSGIDEWSDYRERARKGNKFYFGDQWDASVEQKLKSEGKPALTMNKIKPIIRTLSGYMRQNRRDLRVMARRGGIQTVASIYTELLKYIYDISYADWYKAQAFLDGIIGGKGWISIDNDFTKDPLSGDLIIMREDPFLVVEDPFAQRYDLSDGRFVFRNKWMEKNLIEKMFPQVQDAALDIASIGTEANRYAVETDDYTENDKSNVFEISKNRYLVKECWYRSYEHKKYLVSGFDVQEVTNTSSEILKAILVQRPGMKLVERVMPELNLAIVLGNTILHEEKDPYNGVINFPVNRFCSEIMFSDKMYVRGEVEDIISAQEEHNKRKSQTLHHLNSTASSGYLIEKGALEPPELRKLESMGSRPGVVVTVEEGKIGSVQRQVPAQLSEGHITLATIADTDMKAISGVNADMLGSDKTQANSGIAMEMRRRQGLITTEPIFDNWDFTQKMIGDTLLDIIRKNDFYTPDEVNAIVGDKVKTIDGQQVSEEEIMEYMKSKEGIYGTLISQSNNNPTMRMAHFKEMLSAIREAQVPVPPEMIIEASDWDFKEQWNAWYKSQQQEPPQGPPGVPGGEPMPEGLPPQMGPMPGAELPPEINQLLGVG